ncbi:MAG: glycosyltransferase family 4 protein [Acidobacteriaceae bacterium]|nr:glycosyltransferase family 4 protein [Acidobacteriaceae bacterium]
MLFRAETADHTNKRNSVKKAIRSRALRLFYSRFRRLLPIGVRSYGHYRALGCPENKLVFSPYCVHAQHFQPQESGRYLLRSRMRSHLAAADSDIVLALVGKLSARKGVHVLVKAVKLLPSSLRQRILLLFAGNGAGRHELETACDQDPSVRAHFAGFRNQSELSAIYHASDILVLPSISGETWGLVVNEALLHGVPCIVSDAVGCAPDLVEEGVTGSVCCAGNPAGLASAIEKSLPLLGNASTRERCRAKISGYSVQAAAAGVAAAFEQVLQFA